MVIEARELRRTFRVYAHRPGVWGAVVGLFSRAGRDVDAVRGISFAIEPGAFVGYVGPNGAGKSTTLKMLTGILRPSSGALSVCGLSPHRQRSQLARRIGVVFGQRTGLWWDLPPGEGFALLGHIYQVEHAELRRRQAQLVELLQLEALLDVPVRKLSLGQKMRCELAAALLHRPEVLFLDEPTIGLDVVVKEQVHGFLRRLNLELGTTVVLTSHDLDDIEALCRRVLVIDRGTLLHDGSLASLRTRHGHVRRLELQLRDGAALVELPDGARLESAQGRHQVIAFDAERLSAPELVRHVLAHHDVLDLAVHEARIEDVVKRLYRGQEPVQAGPAGTEPPA